jgi:hypothetical protein
MQTDETADAAHQRLDVVFARHMHVVLAVQLRRQIGTAQEGGDFLLDELGLSFFEDEQCGLVFREGGDFFRHQRVDDVQREDRDARRAEGIGQAKRAQRAHEAVVQAALHDDAEILASRENLVQTVFENVFARGR